MCDAIIGMFGEQSRGKRACLGDLLPNSICGKKILLTVVQNECILINDTHHLLIINFLSTLDAVYSEAKAVSWKKTHIELTGHGSTDEAKQDFSCCFRNVMGSFTKHLVNQTQYPSFPPHKRICLHPSVICGTQMQNDPFFTI